jgi:hypothetical protein
VVEIAAKLPDVAIEVDVVEDIPLALAVGFAMIASYILSTTLVPVLLVWILRHRAQHLASTGPPTDTAARVGPEIRDCEAAR